MFIRFDIIHERDRHTPHDSIGRACIASRGKNAPVTWHSNPDVADAGVRVGGRQ